MRKRLLTVRHAKNQPNVQVASPHLKTRLALFPRERPPLPAFPPAGDDLGPIRTAVVHPVDTDSLLGAIEAAKANLIIPVLVGLVSKIRAGPNQAKIEISSYELVPTEHSQAAATQAIELAVRPKGRGAYEGQPRYGRIYGRHRSREKLRTARRMSHVLVIDAIPVKNRAAILQNGWCKVRHEYDSGLHGSHENARPIRHINDML